MIFRGIVSISELRNFDFPEQPVSFEGEGRKGGEERRRGRVPPRNFLFTRSAFTDIKFVMWTTVLFRRKQWRANASRVVSPPRCVKINAGNKERAACLAPCILHLASFAPTTNRFGRSGLLLTRGAPYAINLRKIASKLYRQYLDPLDSLVCSLALFSRPQLPPACTYIHTGMLIYSLP